MKCAGNSDGSTGMQISGGMHGKTAEPPQSTYSKSSFLDREWKYHELLSWQAKAYCALMACPDRVEDTETAGRPPTREQASCNLSHGV